MRECRASVIGVAMVVPVGLLARLRGDRKAEPTLYAKETKRVEMAGMNAVIAAERMLGFEPLEWKSIVDTSSAEARESAPTGCFVQGFTVT